MNVVKHYNCLIDENNDPVYDPTPLREYMDKWDGQIFIDKMKLDKSKNVLEIGVGTGRLAIKVVPLCHTFLGIDISPKTIARAKSNLSEYLNATLICGDFMTCRFDSVFDVIYSSLTFMHIKEKQKCFDRIYSLLHPNGRLVLSIDKNQDEYIACGNRRLKIYPDNPTETKDFIARSGLTLLDCIETDLAYIFVCRK